MAQRQDAGSSMAARPWMRVVLTAVLLAPARTALSAMMAGPSSPHLRNGNAVQRARKGQQRREDQGTAAFPRIATRGPFDYIPEADRQRNREERGRPGPGQQLVRVESRDGKYHYYRIDTRGGVRLRRQLSSTPCKQGYDWGYDARGIWVNHGCRAEFLVGSQASREINAGPPSWAVGSFQGHDPNRDCDDTLTISADGSVQQRTVFRRGRPAVTQSGSYREGRVYFKGGTLEVQRAGNTIRTVELGGHRSQMSYTRVR